MFFLLLMTSYPVGNFKWAPIHYKFTIVVYYIITTPVVMLLYNAAFESWAELRSTVFVGPYRFDDYP